MRGGAALGPTAGIVHAVNWLYNPGHRPNCWNVRPITGRRVTQTELATRIGWQQTNVSKVEGGERRLDVVEFLQFAEALNIDAGEFVRRLQGRKRLG
jgi:hypothetical protein